MGINSILQNDMQSSGLAGIDRLAGNAMFPQSHMDSTQYATPSQLPTSAEIMRSDYDTPSDAYTGIMKSFSNGGIASIPRYNGKYGSSVFSDDPNNFASDITNAYKTLWGRDPSEQELRANVDALNRNPDAFGFVVDKLANDPNATKFHAGDSKPILDDQGNPVLNEDGQPMMTSAYDPEAASQQLYAGYGKWTPREEPGGFQGFMNKYGPYLPVAMAAAAFAGPALAGEAALEGGAALGAGEVAGGAAGSGSWGLTPELAAELGLEGSTTGLSGVGASGDVLAGMGVEGAAGSSSWGLSPELAQELGLDYSTSGLTDLSGNAGSSTLESMGLNTSGGLTAKQAQLARMGLNMINSGTDQSGTGGYAPQTATAMAPSVMPNVSHGGATGYAGASSAPDYRTIASLTPKTYLSRLSGVPGEAVFAQGGIADLGGYSDGGRLLRGPGDGMSDNIPASIGGKQPARLADGEFVIPADVVSHLGNGSTDAGAKQLYKMMDKIRKARTGTKKQGKQINPNKFLP